MKFLLQSINQNVLNMMLQSLVTLKPPEACQIPSFCHDVSITFAFWRQTKIFKTNDGLMIAESELGRAGY